MTSEQRKALKGLDGKVAIEVSDALVRLDKVVALFGVCGVNIRTASGRKRSCPIGTGHRPVATMLEQLQGEGSRTFVYMEVVVA